MQKKREAKCKEDKKGSNGKKTNLELEGDASDGALLDSSHQVREVPSDLVSESLGRDDGDLLSDALVDVEVGGQAGVVFLDDVASSLLDSVGADTTHIC